ncbi:transmembrane domain-containing protein [Streptomyces sp. NPDC051320]|uniref:EGFR-like transmembrane domain-containing protein n=1 Tax=Streptomyces sp. NPDC051320 TaxID=3154644 RepID=UPI00342BAFE2
MSSNPRGHKRTFAAPLAALLSALALVLVPVLPAAAQPPSPGARIAAGLRTSPVYVDPGYAGSVPPARQKQLAAQIAKTGLPIKVVLVPLIKGDSFNGEPDNLQSVVRDHLTQPDLILITTSDESGYLSGHEWPDDQHQTNDAVSAVGFLDGMRDASLTDQVSKAIELVQQGNGTQVYNDAMGDLGGSAPGNDHKSKDGGTAPWLIVAIAAVAVLGLAGGLLVFVRRRRNHHASGAPFAFPRAVFAAARNTDVRELRRHASAEVIALGESAQSASDSLPGLPRALDAYAAAGKVLDAAHGLPDLAGVLALVTEGRDALAGHDPSALPLCFFNPLHGRAARRFDWRPLGRRDRLNVAACEACDRAVRTRRAPEVLTAPESKGGREIPYFEIPADRSVWAATGYGSLVRSAEDGMAARVGRGEFSHGAESAR